jgi:hypothetical protein
MYCSRQSLGLRQSTIDWIPLGPKEWSGHADPTVYREQGVDPGDDTRSGYAERFDSILVAGTN